MMSRYSRRLLVAGCIVCAPLFVSVSSPARRVLAHHGNNAWQSLNRRMYRVSQTIFNSQPPSNFNAVEFEGTVLTSEHWGSQDLAIADRLIEPQVIIHYIEFLLTGSLPNGKKTFLPLPTPEEVILLSRPSAEWADSPYNADTRSTIDQLMVRVGNHEDPSRICAVGKNIHSLKSRLWQGLVPVSESLWAEKDLDNPRHFETAFQHLTSAIAVFEYLNITQVQTNLRDTFNLMSDHLQVAEAALNANRGGQAPLSLTALWEEFIRAKYEVMTSSAHSWIIAHVNKLRKPVLDEFGALPIMEGEESSPEMKALCERWYQLLTLARAADLTIWMPMDGYHGHKPSGIIPGIHNPYLSTFANAYMGHFNALTTSRLEQAVKAYGEIDDPKIRQNPGDRVQRFLIMSTAQDEMRMEMRGPAPQPAPESWIEKVLQRQGQQAFGLAIYKMKDDIPDEKWTAFKEKFEEHLSAWGDGIERADEVKPLLKLHWFDGKELGLADGDINAAKSHFHQITQSSDEFNPTIFLAIDAWSLLSYTDPKFHQSFRNVDGMLPGDFTGHVLAIDASFDPSEPNEHAEESPGFDGQMRIQGSLVWSELYAMLILQSASLEDLWPLAMEHPQKVYTGPVVPVQRGGWYRFNAEKVAMLGPFLEMMKGKDPQMAKRVERLMMPNLPRV